jgi:hypothetical protein
MPAARNAASHSRPGYALGGDGVEDHQGDDRSEAELGQVECPPDARLVAVEQQRQPGPEDAGGDVLGRGSRNRKATPGTSLNENEWFAQEVDVDDVRLAEEERHGRQWPREVESSGCGGGMSRTNRQ